VGLGRHSTYRTLLDHRACHRPTSPTRRSTRGRTFVGTNVQGVYQVAVRTSAFPKRIPMRWDHLLTFPPFTADADVILPDAKHRFPSVRLWARLLRALLVTPPRPGTGSRTIPLRVPRVQLAVLDDRFDSYLRCDSPRRTGGLPLFPDGHPPSDGLQAGPLPDHAATRGPIPLTPHHHIAILG